MAQANPASPPSDPLAVARRAVDIASDLQASDILLLDVRGLCSYADAFVLLSAESKRQMEAIVADMDEGLSAVGARLLHVEGEMESGWVLIDFGAVVIHVFGPEERAFYGLERLWQQATPLVRIQ